MSGPEKGCVLVVDDEELNCVLVKRCLRGTAQAVISKGGPAALKALEGRSDLLAVFCDLRMPGMDGLDVLAKIREKRPDIVRVIVSAFVDVHTAEQAMHEVGLFRLVVKPFSRDEIVRVAQEALATFQPGVDASPPRGGALDPSLLASLKAL